MAALDLVVAQMQMPSIQNVQIPQPRVAGYPNNYMIGAASQSSDQIANISPAMIAQEFQYLNSWALNIQSWNKLITTRLEQEKKRLIRQSNDKHNSEASITRRLGPMLLRPIQTFQGAVQAYQTLLNKVNILIQQPQQTEASNQAVGRWNRVKQMVRPAMSLSELWMRTQLAKQKVLELLPAVGLHIKKVRRTPITWAKLVNQFSDFGPSIEYYPSWQDGRAAQGVPTIPENAPLRMRS